MKTSTTITITGLLGKPQITSRRTAAAEAIVYSTDGTTTHRIQGFALGLLPQHLPVTVTGETAEDGSIQVQALTLARPIDRDAFMAWTKAMQTYAEAMQEYEQALREYRKSHEDDEDDDDQDEPRRPKLKYPDSYAVLTPEYDRWLRKISGSKKAAQELWEDVYAMLVEPAFHAWLDEDKSQDHSWEDAPYEVMAGACYPYPVPAYATVWRRPPQDFFGPDELLSADQKVRKAAAEKSYTAQRALGDACSAFWRYSILARVLAGITVSQATLDYLRGAGDDDLELLSKAEAHIKGRPDKALVDQLFLDQKPEVIGQLLMDAGLSMADICELEVSGKVPQGSASLPAYTLYLQLAHRAGHVVVDAKAVLDNAWRVLPKEYRGKVRLNSLIALRAAIGRSDSMLRYGVGGTAHGQEIPDDSRYYRYGHVGLLGAIRAERTLARLIDSRRWARKPEDARYAALVAQVAGWCSPDQAAALQTLLATTGDIKILTGGPGTGKTTTLRRYLDIYGQLHPTARIALCAPTGRAAQIHRGGPPAGRPAGMRRGIYADVRAGRHAPGRRPPGGNHPLDRRPCPAARHRRRRCPEGPDSCP